MANTEREVILTMLLIEAVRRLTKNGKTKVHFTNAQLERNLKASFEVDYSNSEADRFVLQLTKGEEITLDSETAFTTEEARG